MKGCLSKSVAETVARNSSKTGERSRGLSVCHRGDFLVPVFSSPKKQVWGSLRLWHDNEGSSTPQITPDEELPQEFGVSLGQGKCLQSTFSFHLPSRNPGEDMGGGTAERVGKGGTHPACLNSFRGGRLEGDGNSLRKAYEKEQEKEVRDGESPQKGSGG